MADISIDKVREWLDQPGKISGWASACGLSDAAAHRSLVAIAESRVTLDLITALCQLLQVELPLVSDPDMTLANLERLIVAARSPLSLASLVERDPQSLSVLVRIFSTSQSQSDVLIDEPESFDLLRMTEGQPVARDVLVEEILSEIAAVGTDKQLALTVLRRIKQRETLRIAYGDLVRGQGVEIVSRQISFLADAIISAALHANDARLQAKYGAPISSRGEVARFTCLAFRRLGGFELSYSGNVDLLFLYDEEGSTNGDRSINNSEYFNKLVSDTLALLVGSVQHSQVRETGESQQENVYNVSLRMQPNGRAVRASEALLHYDTKGRTWERQAFVKARPIAGDLEFGRTFLKRLEPWVYRRYLTRADISGIKALKRKVEKRAAREAIAKHDVRDGPGGIRDIEFVVQFLQLLNAGDASSLRIGNTLDAVARLEQVGCLTVEERNLLEQNYSFLRSVEHGLQLIMAPQTHVLPTDDPNLRKLAEQIFRPSSTLTNRVEKFHARYDQAITSNRRVLDHLLHEAFGDEEEIEPEVDLILDPEPSQTMIHAILEQHRFRDPDSAYSNLIELSEERVRFLSTRRCRHFLAAIAPRLLAAISETPDPDRTLTDLSRVSDSLGGKGVLWELFSSSDPSLRLYVRLCAACPYLSDILTSNPGMIDALMDSLAMDRLPSHGQLARTVAVLCRGADNIELILHNFKNAQHLTVGVRDILGKDSIRQTLASLSDTAEVSVQQIILREYYRLAEKYGVPALESPTHDASSRAGDLPETLGLPVAAGDCELVVVGLGKFGGYEPNYHSNIELVFLYEADGRTVRTRGGDTTNQHFFGELAQRVIRFVNRLGPHGRLFEADARLPAKQGGGVRAYSFEDLRDYFASSKPALWERQALCKARPVFGGAAARDQVKQIICQAITSTNWTDTDTARLQSTRTEMERTASQRNLKRGLGGTVDIEFTVQMLQLRHASQHPGVLVPNTFAAIKALNQSGALSDDDAHYFGNSYRFLRGVESGLRLMNTTAKHDLPDDEDELARLAYLLNMSDGPTLVRRCEQYTTENRRRFERLFAAAMAYTLSRSV